MGSNPFLHAHPYEPFLFEGVKKVIVGTLPPPRFTTRKLFPEDVDFCYGSRNGQLWPILDQIFDLKLRYDQSEYAIEQRKRFLWNRKIGICDIVDSAERTKVDASDLGMENIQLRDLVGYLRKYPSIHTLLFTGGNSKNGPEYLFRRHLRDYGLKLVNVRKEVPREHAFVLPVGKENKSLPLLKTEQRLRIIKTISLIAPSGAANRAVGSLKAYKEAKEKDPNFTTIDFRILQYRNHF